MIDEAILIFFLSYLVLWIRKTQQWKQTLSRRNSTNEKTNMIAEISENQQMKENTNQFEQLSSLKEQTIKKEKSLLKQEEDQDCLVSEVYEVQRIQQDGNIVKIFKDLAIQTEQTLECSSSLSKSVQDNANGKDFQLDISIEREGNPETMHPHQSNQPPPSDQILTLKAENEQLKDILASTQNENRDLRSSIERQKRKCMDKEEQAIRQINKLEKRIKDLQLQAQKRQNGVERKFQRCRNERKKGVIQNQQQDMKQIKKKQQELKTKLEEKERLNQEMKQKTERLIQEHTLSWQKNLNNISYLQKVHEKMVSQLSLCRLELEQSKESNRILTGN